jgi:hypothetical protein
MIKKLARILVATLYICSLLVFCFLPAQPVKAVGTLAIDNAKVFSSVIQNNDWLVCIYYNNEYDPPYPTGLASEYFDIIFDTTGVDFKVPQADWGYKPIWIYISPTNASTLTWKAAYDVTVLGKPSKYALPLPTDTYNLVVGDWLGTDPDALVAWVRTTAQDMTTYYGKDYYTETYGGTTFPVGEGILTPLGSKAFLDGMPGLDSLHPELFVAGGSDTTYGDVTFNKTYENSLDWETTMGTGISDIANDTGTLFNLSGRMITAFITFLIYCGLAAMAFKAVPEPQTGIILALPVPFFGFWAGFIDLAIAGVIGGLIIMLTVYLLWIRGS